MIKNFFLQVYHFVVLKLTLNPYWVQSLLPIIFSIWPFVVFAFQLITFGMLHPLFLLMSISVTPLSVELYSCDPFSDGTFLLPRIYCDFTYTPYSPLVGNSVVADTFERFRQVPQTLPYDPFSHYRHIGAIPPAWTCDPWHPQNFPPAAPAPFNWREVWLEGEPGPAGVTKIIIPDPVSSGPRPSEPTPPLSNSGRFALFAVIAVLTAFVLGGR